MAVQKILCCCGRGLGSSFMMEQNVQKVLNKLNRGDITVSHGTMADAVPGAADLLIVCQELYGTVRDFGEVIALRNIVSLTELEEKLSAFLSEE